MRDTKTLILLHNIVCCKFRVDVLCFSPCMINLSCIKNICHATNLLMLCDNLRVSCILPPLGKVKIIQKTSFLSIFILKRK